MLIILQIVLTKGLSFLEILSKMLNVKMVIIEFKTALLVR